MKINAKVYWNKKNKQAMVYIPKKNLEVVPEKVNITIPKTCFKKKMGRKLWI